MTGTLRSSLALGALALALTTACTSPGARRIVGPDGSPMAHVHCGSEQAECFRLAGELCPSGYEMQPVLSGNHGNFLVRCRVAGAVAKADASCPAPAGGATPAAVHASNAGWPATSQPWPADYAWPPPEMSAGVHQTPTPPSGEPDLGY